MDGMQHILVMHWSSGSGMQYIWGMYCSVNGIQRILNSYVCVMRRKVLMCGDT